jgi:HK97 family phage portal protein
MGIIDRLAPVRAEATTLRSPATWFLEALFGRESSSGVRVSEATALNLSPYYCGVLMISGTVGSLPCNVYKRDGKKRDVWDQHPAHWLLHNEPNPEMTAMSLRQSWVMHAIARGNAYGEIVWDRRGQPAAIWPLLPHMTRPLRDDTGQLWYEVRPWDKEVRYLRPENVLHIPGLGYDGIMGYGLIQVARDAIGLHTSQDAYAAKYFQQGGNVSGVIEVPTVLQDAAFQRLKKEIAEKFSGLTNAHRIAILEAGMKFNALNPTHEQTQLVESRKFSVQEWARWLNMPPHKLKDMSEATFSNIEHQNIEWVVDTIRPWLVRFEQEFNRKLFFKQTLFYTKHVVEGLLRGDLKARFDAYAVARNWGWMSADDVLELEDRNPLPGKQGQMYLVPANMMPADQVGKKPVPPAPGSPAPQAPTPVPPAGPAERLARVGAERVVRLEERAGHSEDFRSKLCEWLTVRPETAAHYCEVAAQLNLLAEDHDVGATELRARKVDLLVELVMGEAHAA